MMNLPLFPPPPLVAKPRKTEIWKGLPSLVDESATGCIYGAYRLDSYHAPGVSELDELLMIEILRDEVRNNRPCYGDITYINALSPTGELWRLRFDVEDFSSGEPARN